ncbi:hypothetical protein BU26DRAFT_131472 [Trematosphaeria pertusa]|uniref:Secreted protein n=1 Tax=Trematosphaeria pertusa TaxID=390896 RepID=A0A6A6HYC6_9PLEO|nr:uncharacterized protein BU26DRAFT_131472 [Trematosphaeria pertusa]KAF2242722.1 hypothetical protein BU26DRAFT_131472 [Trematosphaeria pertusa]
MHSVIVLHLVLLAWGKRPPRAVEHISSISVRRETWTLRRRKQLWLIPRSSRAAQWRHDYPKFALLRLASTIPSDRSSAHHLLLPSKGCLCEPTMEPSSIREPTALQRAATLCSHDSMLMRARAHLSLVLRDHDGPVKVWWAEGESPCVDGSRRSSARPLAGKA